jgi:class 3 adenylate cyclase
LHLAGNARFRAEAWTCEHEVPQMTDTATLDRARKAMEDHAWKDAYEGYVQVAADGPLAGEDQERLAEAAWLSAHPKESLEAIERAYAAYVEEGNPARAAYAALTLADEYEDRLQQAIANAWFHRATRLLEGQPEGAEHGYLELALARRSLMSGAMDEAARHAAGVLDIGTRFGDRNLQAFGLVLQGMMLVAQADVEKGLALIDEATLAAVAGELDPIITGIIYCITIDVCRDLADFRRAGDWTEAAARWCERQDVHMFPGVCRVHRAEVMRLRGALSDAENEARRSIDELTAFGKLPVVSAALYEIGEIRLRIGDLDAAEDAFAQAHELGHEAQPGMSMLHLARGRTDAARASITTALADLPVPMIRARLLPARVEIALAGHDVADAREAAEELREIASLFDSPVMHANAHQAIGAALTYEGDAPGAVAELRKAVRHWREADMPLETAQAQRCLALAYRLGGDEASAALELRAAKAAFERLGAMLETARCDDMIRAAEAGESGRRVARTFMFTDIVGSTNLLETMGDEAWENVSRWHNETLKGLIDAHRGEVVHSTGDGFFITFEDATAAATCAVEIQQRLEEHRRRHGFAPQVRIGLHADEATAMADDYAGLGVHEAARVAALAEGGEIVVTCDTVEGEPIPFAVVNERAVPLKGIAQPVRVVTIDWRAAAP